MFGDLTSNAKLRKDTYHDVVNVRGYSFEPPPGVGPVAAEDGYKFCKFKIKNFNEVKRRREDYINSL